MNFKPYFILLCLFLSLSLMGQTHISGIQGYSFQIPTENDTIEFISLSQDLDTPKPTLLFCQGTLPLPLIVQEPDGEQWVTAFAYFDYEKLSAHYHLILIATPHTPLISPREALNENYAYILDPDYEHSYSPEYLQANYLQKYIERGTVVIDYLSNQKWVDKKRIYVAGHSQGAKTAVKLAAENKWIAGLGFLSGNPLGRVDQYIREYRQQQQKGLISAEEAQEKINETYDWWKWMHENINRPSIKGEDSPKTTLSFSNPVLPDLLKLEIPVFIGYGTEDLVASYCDLLPLDFIRAGKENFKLVTYPGLDHNYCELDATGHPVPEKCHWQKVMTDFTQWIENN